MLSPVSGAHDERVHIEELEVDADMLASSEVERFLRKCAVGAREIRKTLERAGVIVAASGAALLKVQLPPAAAAVKVSAPSSLAPQA